jgi:regulator of sigma D
VNYLKTKTYFINLHNEKINQFFEYLYLASEEELNARVIQVYSHIKELCKKNEIKKLNKKTFNYIIENTPDYIYADHLSKFDCVEHFKGFSKNKLNKFFYLFDREKKKLDEMSKKKFFTIRIIIKVITDMMKNELEISDDDLYIYKPRKDANYYTKYINKQGERLKRRLNRLYLHFNEYIQ